MCEVGYKLKKE